MEMVPLFLGVVFIVCAATSYSLLFEKRPRRPEMEMKVLSPLPEPDNMKSPPSKATSARSSEASVSLPPHLDAISIIPMLMSMSTVAAVNITFTFPTKQAQLIHLFASLVIDVLFAAPWLGHIVGG
jgi:hypothetical protein